MAITVKLQGGLGNQLFIYAFGKALENATGYEVVFEDSEYRGDSPYRKYELSYFNVDTKTVQIKQKKSVLKKILRELLIFKSLKNKIDVYSNKIVYKRLDNGFKFNPDFANVNDGELIEGFYQNENYFINIKDKIHNDFELVEPLDEINKKILNDIKNTESISIHIRRGDYLNTDYGICTKDYYEQGINIIKEKTNFHKLKAFIFTDAPEWVKENTNFNVDTYYVENNQGKGYFDLELMKNCKHNIIANSSFSWWGAWLNENPNKIVIAPKPWFLSVENDYELIPDSWIRLNAFE